MRLWNRLFGNRGKGESSEESRAAKERLLARNEKLGCLLISKIGLGGTAGQAKAQAALADMVAMYPGVILKDGTSLTVSPEMVSLSICYLGTKGDLGQKFSAIWKQHGLL
jgi:hypothetical protein